MIVDLLRSCYSTNVRFFLNSSKEVRIRWYRSPVGATVFPGYTRFASGNWASDRIIWPGTGEVLGAKRVWSPGITPRSATGQSFCGTLEQFRLGIVLDESRPPMQYDVWGIPACCTGQPGGVVLGGEAKTSTAAGGMMDDGSSLFLPQCVLWLRGDDFVSLADGDPVTLWQDHSPVARQMVFVGNPAFTPIKVVSGSDGRPGVEQNIFAGGGFQWSAGNWSMESEWTLFVVANSQGGIIVQAGPWIGLNGLRVFTSGAITTSTVAPLTVADPLDTNRHIWTVRLKAATISVEKDGVELGSQAHSGAAPGGLMGFVAIYSGGVPANRRCVIYEVLVMNRHITDATYNAVLSYLTEKYP